MPIKIIESGERLIWRYPKDETTALIYRRIPDSVRAEFNEQCRDEHGKIDTREIGRRALEYAVIDWRGIVDGAGDPVPFRIDLIGFLPDGLISPFISVLLDGTQAELDEEAELAKNSSGTSGNGSD